LAHPAQSMDRNGGTGFRCVDDGGEDGSTTARKGEDGGTIARERGGSGITARRDLTGARAELDQAVA
jgi:hypothetical protein